MVSAEATARHVVGQLLDRPPTLRTARLLALDGPAGSGKTTLAGACAEVLRTVPDRADASVVVVRLDDLYDGWSGLDEALERRIIDQILRPLSVGGAARWQRYDWQTQRFAEWHDLRLPGVLILEGCGAGARAFAPFTTLLVWVEAASPSIRRARMVDRDGPAVLEHLADWRRRERATFERNRTKSRADVQVDT